MLTSCGKWTLPPDSPASARADLGLLVAPMLGMVASGVSLALAGWSSPKSAKSDPGLLRPSTLEISAV
eukprot:s1905_g5.t1